MTHQLLRFSALFAFTCFGLASANAQITPTFSFEFTEKPGPYAVGLRVVEQYGSHQAETNALTRLSLPDGSFRYSPEIVQKAEDVHPDQLAIPLLVFSRAEESLETWDAMWKDKSQCVTAPNLLNEWTRGDLIHVRLLAFSHIQFSSLYQRSERFRKEGLQFVPADYSLEDGAESYNWMARYLLEFLNAYLKHDQAASDFLTHTPAENSVPKHLISMNLRHASTTQVKDHAPTKQ
jgi:hypothetical protein